MRNLRSKSLHWLFALSLLSLAVMANGGFENANQIQNPDFLYGDGKRQLSDINILLPVQNCTECRRVYHTVAAFNGCYQWKSSHPALLHVEEQRSKTHAECANIAEVSNVQPREFKNIVWLTAKDLSKLLVYQLTICRNPPNAQC